LRAKKAACEEKRKWAHTACRKKKDTSCKSTIAIEEESKERNPRQLYRMVQKIKCGYKPHTDLCKDTKGNIIGDKEQIKGSWKEHCKEILNKNKHNNKTRPRSEPNKHTGWGNGNTGTNKAKNRLSIHKLNSNTTLHTQCTSGTTQAWRRSGNE
jgi:hypothetical protein